MRSFITYEMNSYLELSGINRRSVIIIVKYYYFILFLSNTIVFPGNITDTISGKSFLVKII